jgi:tetratricopeptide (TPR) repeat protein
MTPARSTMCYLANLSIRHQVAVLTLILPCVAALGCERSKPNPIPVSATTFLDAQEHFEAGETEKALELVSASLEREPSTWAYFLRAQIYLKLGDESKALADCDAGLRVDPGDAKLTWLKGELAKPAAARFQGAFKNPPAADR